LIQTGERTETTTQTLGRLDLSLCTHARVANSNKSCDTVINLKKNKIK